MKPIVLVDTGFWIALMDRRDQNHTAAVPLLQRLLSEHRMLVPDFIIFETLTYLNCSVRRHDLALRFLEKTDSGVLDVADIDRPLRDQALALFRQYANKDFSVTDCTSFALMRQRGVQQFAGFDGHFIQMGFVPLT